jgi:predicted alpha/beta superfamily hydrolase
MLPACRRGELARFPVVYVTDGNFAFDAIRSLSYSIQTLERDAPRFIVVGIGYPSGSPKAGVMLRCRDLTFPGYPRFSTRPLAMEDIPLVEEGSKDFYGGEEFQQFIAAELIPFIDEQYPTVPENRTLFGHSLGGAFGLFSLFSRPGLFQRYIVSSPSVHYHGETSAGERYDHYDFLYRSARNFIASKPFLDDVKVYMSVGTEEEFEPNLAEWQFTSSFYRLVGLLKAAPLPGLSVSAEALVGETHMTAWPIAFMHGIQAVFGTRVWSRL